MMSRLDATSTAKTADPMRVLVTGHDGYLGSIIAPLLQEAGHRVVGLDNFMFYGCEFGEPAAPMPAMRLDVRDVQVANLAAFDAVVHLAGVSGDALGDLAPALTRAINHDATVRLATLAREAGVSRFVLASSCNAYGSAGDLPLDEDAPLRPITPYGAASASAEVAVHQLADASFATTVLRCGSAYGVSPRLRTDLVVNNLVSSAVTTGEVLLTSSGTAWRPLVHVADIGCAFVACLRAPAERVSRATLNVGTTTENYRIRDVAQIVQDIVPHSIVKFASGAPRDARSFHVRCDRILQTLPDFQPRWTLRHGIEELYYAYREFGRSPEELSMPRFHRRRHVQAMLALGTLATDWRVVNQPVRETVFRS